MVKRTRNDRGVVDGKKICSGCHIDKSVSEFNKQSSAKTGLRARCRACQKIDSAKYMRSIDNAEKSRLWRVKNKDKLKAYNKLWLEDPKNRENQLNKHKAGADARYRVFTNEDYIKSFIILFSEGMTFDNYGEWEVDHIIPVSAWLDAGVTDLDVINSIDNLQPLWKKENAKKSNKIEVKLENK